MISYKNEELEINDMKDEISSSKLCYFNLLKDDNLVHIFRFLCLFDRLIFCSLNRLLFFKIKSRHYYYNLSQKNSEKYITNKEFNKKLNSRVVNKGLQIGVNIHFFENNINSSMLDGIHSVSIYRFNFKHVNNIESLGNVKKLTISSGYNLYDVSMFRNIETLMLLNCRSITDVSMLGNIRYLYLRGCKSITDVSNLGRVHHLDLAWCDNITDICCIIFGKCRFLKSIRCKCNLSEVRVGVSN